MRDMDPRVEQAKKLWEKGLGNELKIASFFEYLIGVPLIPDELIEDDSRFPELVLVDARLDTYSNRCRINSLCRILGIDYNQEIFFKNFDDCKPELDPVYWMRCNDGRCNSNRSVNECESDFIQYELPLSIHEGIALYAQRPQLFEEWTMALPRSPCIWLAGGAMIGHFIEVQERPFVSRYFPDERHPNMGVATRRK